MSSATPDAFSGTEQFRVEEKLGEGGFGTVYKAFDTKAGQLVALKLLHRRDARALLRFKEEFRHLVQLSHPNLVSLYELHQQGRHWFFTMEFIEGRPFQAHLTSASLLSSEETLGDLHPTPPRDDTFAEAGLLVDAQEPAPPRTHPEDAAPSLPPWSTDPTAMPDHDSRSALREGFLQLAEGIGFLHRCGKLHCDIKPSNVMVEEGGRVVLLDFGLLQPLGASARRVERTAGLVGTPQFMAPEVCAGQNPTAASDWYSYGVVLYLALTGTLPFRGSSLKIVVAKQAHDAVPASGLARGIPPDLDRLCTALLSRDPSARPTYDRIVSIMRGEIGPFETPSPTPSRPELPPPPFLGRETELRRLHAAHARPGLSIALISGPSGFGKTALAERFLASVPEDTWVLRSRCYERGTVAYKAFDGAIDGLSAYLRALPSHDWQALKPDDMWALARLFRVLEDLSHTEAPAGASDVQSARQIRRRAHVALRELLGRLEHRTVLVIDDLQWADDDSVAIFSELVRPSDSSPPPPMTLIAMVRSDEASDTLRHILEQLEGAQQVERIALGPLQEAAVRALAASLLGGDEHEDLIDRLVRASEGSPLFLDELVRHHDTSGDAEQTHGELTAMIQRRVQRLPEQARRFVELVAVAGEPVSDAHVTTALAGDRPRDGLKHLSSILHQRLLRTTAATLVAPYHDRIREAVVGGLSPRVLRDHHLALARTAVSHRPDDPEFIAVHFRAANEPGRARHYAIAAGDRAFDTLAFDRAAHSYREALQLRDDPDGRVWMRLAESLKNAGRGIEAAEAYLAAAQRFSADEEQSQQVRIAAVEQFLFAGAYDAGEAVIREVLGALGLKVAGSMPAAFLDLGWQSLKLKRRGQAFTLRTEQELPARARRHIDILWSATIGLSMANPIASQAIQKRHLRAALDGGEPFRLGRALSIELAFSGIPGGSDESLSDALSGRGHALVAQIDDHYSKPFMSMSDGAVHWLRGRWQAAHDTFLSSLNAYREHCTGVTWEIDTAQFVVLNTRAHMGELASVRRELPALLADAVERGDLYFETQVRTCFSPLLGTLCEDRPEAAVDALTDAIARWTPRGYHIVHFWTVIRHVEALLYRGRGVDALRRLKAEELALFRSLLLTGQYYRVQYHDLRARASLAAALETGVTRLKGRLLTTRAAFHARRLLREDVPWAWALGHLARAMIALARGDETTARAALGEADKHADAVDMRLHAAVARRTRAELLGDTTDAVDDWLRGQDIARPERVCATLAPRS